MQFDHIALISKNISESIDWYKKNVGDDVIVKYQDPSWGLISIAGCDIAFVLKEQHPAHICFNITPDDMPSITTGKNFKKHRDGTSSCYVKDVDGNIIEYLIR